MQHLASADGLDHMQSQTKKQYLVILTNTGARKVHALLSNGSVANVNELAAF